MINSKSSQRHLIAIDSTRSGTHGAKRFIKTVLTGLLNYTKLNIVVFASCDSFNSFEDKRLNIVHLKSRRGTIMGILNTCFTIPILARLHQAKILYSPWDIGPLIKPIPYVLGIHSSNHISPTGYESSGTGIGIRLSWLHKFLVKISARSAFAIEFPSNSAADCICEDFGIDKGKRNVIYHGAELSKWKKTLKQIKSSNTKNHLGEYFIFWSWFYKTKNIETLLEGFSKYIDSKSGNKDLNLVCAGKFVSTAYQQEILMKIEQLNIQDKVIFLDQPDDAELVKLIHYSKGIVIPSLYETFGFMYVEGRLFDKPLIAADTDVAREITEGQCIYFKGRDSDDLALKIGESLVKNNNEYSYRISPLFYEENASKYLAEFFLNCYEKLVSFEN